MAVLGTQRSKFALCHPSQPLTKRQKSKLVGEPALLITAQFAHNFDDARATDFVAAVDRLFIFDGLRLI